LRVVVHVVLCVIICSYIFHPNSWSCIFRSSIFSAPAHAYFYVRARALCDCHFNLIGQSRTRTVVRLLVTISLMVNALTMMTMSLCLGHSFLQRISIACYAERCTSYSKSVRPSVCLSVIRWHCVKTTQATITGFPR